MEVEPLPVDPSTRPPKTNREPLPLWIKLLFGTSIAAAVVLAFVLRGNLTHFIIFVACFSSLVLVSVLAAALAGLAQSRKGRGRSPGILRPKIVSGLVAVAFALAFQLMGYAVGEGLHEHDLRSAQRFLMDLVPDLDAAREENGVYPEALDGLVAPETDLPRLVAGRLGDVYRVDPDGAAFAFVLEDPGAMFFGGWRWDSTERGWRTVD